MNLATAIDIYIILKRSLGLVFQAESRILHSFLRVTGNVPIEMVSRTTCRSFCQGVAPPTRWWERKYYTLRNFFEFLVSRGYLTDSPVVDACPKIIRTFEPYIYSHEEIKRLLDAAGSTKSQQRSLQPNTFRILLLTLYAAGLRPGECLRLRRCDVNFSDPALNIWNTKFFKSRLVPIGNDLGRALKCYYTFRGRLSLPQGENSAFFASPTGHPITLQQLERSFVRLREHTAVQRPMAARWQPRLHDFRHSFAVHRLVAWYREGADLKTCLPLLATYLGHINISSTQTYLTMTPDLLAEASKRFENYVFCNKENTHEG